MFKKKNKNKNKNGKKTVTVFRYDNNGKESKEQYTEKEYIKKFGLVPSELDKDKRPGKGKKKKKEKKTDNFSYESWWGGSYYNCHGDYKKLTRHIYGLSMARVKDFIRDIKPDVLVPLDSVSTRIWDFGFKGDIIYIPIPDGETLPRDILKKQIDKLTNLVRAGKTIGIFCIGGHGRTGYIMSCLVWQLLGIETPISFIRENYCKKAVETREQVREIEKFTGCLEKATGTYEVNKAVYGFKSFSFGEQKPLPLNGGGGVCYKYENEPEDETKHDNGGGITRATTAAADTPVKEETAYYCYNCNTIVDADNLAGTYQNLCAFCHSDKLTLMYR